MDTAGLLLMAAFIWMKAIACLDEAGGEKSLLIFFIVQDKVWYVVGGPLKQS